MPGEGESVATELFYMRIGTLRYSRRWIDPDAVLRGQIFLTALSGLLLLLAGFVLGWVAARTTAGNGGGGGGGGQRPMISFGSGAVYGYGDGGSGIPSSMAAASVSSFSSSSWLDGVVGEFGGSEGINSDGGCERCDFGGPMDIDNMFSLASRSRANVSSVY